MCHYVLSFVFCRRDHALSTFDLCLLTYGGVQHKLCCVFALFVFVLFVPYIDSFSGLSIFECPLRYSLMFIMSSPTKLRRDIITLSSVLPQHPCEHSRINILQWILTKLGTYLVLKRIWNSIDFQGQGHRVNFLGEGIRHALRCPCLLRFGFVSYT